MNQQRGQTKVVDPVRFIRVSEIRQVLAVRDVGLSDHDGIGLRTFDNQPEQANQLVGLGQIHTGGAGLLPQEGHRIEAEHSNTRVQQLADNADELQHDGRVAEIEIDLIRAEGTPDRPLS